MNKGVKTILQGSILGVCLFLFLPITANASTLRAEQTTVDTCDGVPCSVEVNGGFGEYFNVVPLSDDPTDYVAEVEIYIVDNNSNGYEIEVCNNITCVTSPTLDEGVRIQNQWRGYNFSDSRLSLRTVSTIKVNDTIPEVYVGATLTDVYPNGEITDGRTSLKDIAFKIYGVTPPPGTITIVKSITNNNGGSGTAANFRIALRYSSDANNITPSDVSEPVTTYSVPTGDYVLYQFYNDVQYSASISGDCAEDGSIHIEPSEAKTCTASFDDIPGAVVGRSNRSVDESEVLEPAITLPTVSFSGRAYPGATLTLIKKVDGSNEVLKQGIYLEQYGNFSAGGIVAESLSYSLAVKDRFGRPGPTKTYNRKSANDSLTVKNILFAPTVDFVRAVITKGDLLRVIGSAFPDMYVQVKLDNGILYETKSDLKGTYRVNIKSALLDPGAHSVVVRAIDANTGQKSDFSVTKNFVVSTLTVVAADLNGDNAISITDWSIFLEKWRQVKASNTDLVSSIDFNKDEKVDISDFAIFLRAFSKK